MKTILFTGGGSAGHVLPNVALIEELLTTGDTDVVYMGTDGIEKTLVGERKIPFYQIDCPKLIRGGGVRGLKRNLGIPMRLRQAIKQASSALQKIKPDLVFSKGGYVALPVVLAASKAGIPCLSHESDFSVGLANRLLAKKCVKVFTSFPETAKRISHGAYSGAPIRREIFNANRTEARQRLGIHDHDVAVLIFGGGSGSQCINDAVRKHVKALTDRYFVLHVCGKGNLAQCNLERYKQFEFITDMGMAYAASDLIVSRAGAGAIFEILSLQKPALFIPLEGQTRGDQLQNANYFHAKHLCKILRQNQLDELPNALDELSQDTQLQTNLKESLFRSGNAVILQEIRRLLRL